jgi:hypothetical protein
VGRDRVVALDAAARAHLALGDHAAAADVAQRGLAMADETGFGSLAWRLGRVAATALHALGEIEEAAALAAVADERFDALLRRIDEPGLRDSFRRLAITPH